MPTGGRMDATSKILGVWLTDDATENGNRVAFEVDKVTLPDEQGTTVYARDFSPHNRTFLHKPRFKVIVEDMPRVLWYALKTANALNSTRETIIYHRFGTFDGDAKPDRTAGGLYETSSKHNYAGDQAKDVVIAVAATEGTWVVPS